MFGRAKPRVSKPAFSGERGRVHDETTGIVVGLGATPELETVCFGFRDPAFRSGAQIKLIGSTLFESAPGEPPHPRSAGRACGFDVRMDLDFAEYLHESGRSGETLHLNLHAALTAIATQEFRISPDAVVVSVRPPANPKVGDAAVAPIRPEPGRGQGDPAGQALQIDRIFSGPGSDLGSMLHEGLALDASVPGKTHMFWGGGYQHPNGFHIENWEAAALIKAQEPNIITVDQTPMGIWLDSLTMRDGAHSERFLAAVDALARSIGPIENLGNHSFIARIANVFWRAALARFAMEASGHVYVISKGAGEKSAINQNAMPGLVVRVNSGFVAALNGSPLPKHPPAGPGTA